MTASTCSEECMEASLHSHGVCEGPGRVSRRKFLQGALLGGAAAVELPGRRSLRAAPSRQDPSTTLTLVTPRTPSDLDPHSAYDAGSGVALRGPFEGLIRLKPGTTEEYEPVLAESWETNAAESLWTFRLRDGVTFQDGTPLDAFAARASFERLFSLRLAPSTVLGRFLADAAQISAPDPRTLVFDLGRPQPLFLAALAADFGTAIVNVAALRAHEVDGDWGHAWAQTSSEGLGTGPYRIRRIRRRDRGRPGTPRRVLAGVAGRAFRPGHPPCRRRAGDATPLDRKRRRRHRRRLAADYRARVGGEPGPGRRSALQPDGSLSGNDRRRAAGVAASAPGALLGLSLRRRHRGGLRGVRQARDRAGRRVVPRLRPGHVRLRDGSGASERASAARREWRREPH